jgi:hypothetical protein
MKSDLSPDAWIVDQVSKLGIAIEVKDLSQPLLHRSSLYFENLMHNYRVHWIAQTAGSQ